MEQREATGNMCQPGAMEEGEFGRAATGLIDGPTASRLASTFKALSDPTRVRIISVLSHSEMCVHDVASLLGVSQSAISHQLRTLREMRLVKFRREGRHVYYTLDDEHVHRLFDQGLDHIKHD